METANYLVLSQKREDSEYNDFIGKFYHFPAGAGKSYLNFFKKLPIEFVYYDPAKTGKGEFFGYGKINKAPFADNREKDNFFVEISEYKSFSKPVPFKDSEGNILEKLYSPETYNSQNAVRTTTKKFVEEICLDGGIILNFKADAHLIKVLGEQLIGSEKVGILELVKNAIDANATYCNIRLEKLPALPYIDEENYLYNEYEGPVIVIEDDGVGMSKEVIENGWLRPASTIKTNVKVRLKEEREKAEKTGKLGSYNSLINQLKKENNGRIPLGEKGVGRFATHRLGKNLIITTKTDNADYELVLKINWDSFDQISENKIDLDNIGVELTRQSPSRNYGERNCGTRIIIFGGREGFIWDEEKIYDINQSILRLNSPNPNPSIVSNSFEATLLCPQIENLETNEIYERYPSNFTLDALVNASGIIDEYELKFIPPKSVPLPPETWKDKNYDLRKVSLMWKDENNKLRQPSCGQFFIHVEAWYRKKPWIDGPDSKNMIDYLDNYGGISIYRDNIIIFPAESGSKNDWLNLSKRHIKQGFRLSYYNLIGNIEIEQTQNIDLIDKSDRESMVQNTAFSDLALLVETIIQNILEVKYIDVRDRYTNLTKDLIRDPKSFISATGQVSEIIEGVSDNYSIKDDPWNILTKLGDTVEERKEGLINLSSSVKNLKKSVELMEEVQERLTEQAGFGLGVSVTLHEFNKIASNFLTSISKAAKSGKLDKLQIENLKSSATSLRTELKRFSPLRTVRNENRKEFNIGQSIHYVHELYKMKLEKERIQFICNYKDDFQLYGRYSALNQIFSNLVDNSIYWLSMSNQKNKKIEIRLNKKFRTLIFADNGEGIDPIISKYLFEPGYSMKVPPSGLGLYICKFYMHSMNGNIHQTVSRERIKNLDGAQFTIEFEGVPESKELAK